MTAYSLVLSSFLISNLFSALITVVVSAHESAPAREDVSWARFSVLHRIPEEVVGWEVSCKINYGSICKESSVSQLTLKKRTSLPISIFSA